MSKKYLTKTEISDNRSEIIHLLESTKREGIDKVIKFLDKSNFFTLKGSYRHHSYTGGLAEHSLGVYHKAMSQNKKCNENSIAIAALLHDTCKTYCKGSNIPYYKGHGNRSAQILEDYVGFHLTDEERRAIRFHMMHKKSDILNEEKEYEKAEREELRTIIHYGDCLDAACDFSGVEYLLNKVLGIR